jgi:hypothetical protein
MMLVEEADVFTMGISSIQVTEINPNTARNIATRLGGNITEEIVAERLGVRKVGLPGIVTKLFLCFGSFAYEIAWVDDMGNRNGTMGVIFPGEYKKIPNILVFS